MSLIGTPTTTYQTFTEEMQAAAFQLGVGLFGVPLGTSFLTEVSNYMTQTQGATIDSLYDVAMSGLGSNVSFYPTYLSNTQFADRLATKLLGAKGAVVADDAWQAGADWVKAALDGGMSRAAAAKMAVEAVAAVDSTDASYGAAAATFANKITVAEYYTFTTGGASTDITALAAVIANVDSTAASVTAAQAAADAGETGGAGGQTYTLTTTGDSFTGTTGDDTFIAGYDKFGSDDVLNGGGGLDVLSADVGSTAIAPQITNIEQVNLNFRNASASISLADSTGYTALTITGTTDGAITNLGDAGKVTLSAYDDTISIDIDAGANTTANTITVTVSGDSSGAFNLSAGGTSDIETVNLVVNQTSWKNTAGALDFGSAAYLNISGTGDVTLVGSAMASIAADSLKSINASALAGDLNLKLGDTRFGIGTAIAIVGGAGDDTVNFQSSMGSTDSFDGGAGTDTLSLLIGATNTVRPNVSNVETLAVEFDAAGQFDGRSAAGFTTLNVDADDGDGLFTRLLDVATINFQSANDNTDDLSVTYQTAQDKDIAITLGSTSTAFNGFSAGDLTVAGNNGTVELSIVGTGNHSLASATFANATAFTLTTDVAGSASLELGALNLATAQSVTFEVNNLVDMTSALLSQATTLTINATGTGAAFSAGQIVGNKLQTVTIAGSGLGASEVEVGLLDLAATAFTTMSVTSDSTAAINFSAVNVAGSAAAPNFDVTVNTNGVFDADFVMVGEITTVTAVAAADVTFDISGSGSAYNITLGVATASNWFGSVVVDASTLGSASKLNAAFTAGAVASATIEATLGAGDDTFSAGAGNDTIDGGAGADSIFGGAGADSITGGAGNDLIDGGLGNDYIIAGAGSNTINMGTAGGTDTIELVASTASTAGDIILYSAADNNTTGILGDDTILFARSGDLIRFQLAVGTCAQAANGMTAGASLSATNASGGFYACAITNSAMYNSADELGKFALYSNGADTVIEVVVGTGAASAAIQRVILEGISLGVTSAQFTMTVAATGMAIALI